MALIRTYVRKALIMSNKKWIAAAVAAGGAAVIAVTGGVAQADDETAPTSAVEDFVYPGAARILAAQNVKLISGNGKIVIADCNNPPDADITFIYVYTLDRRTNGGAPICFQVLRTPGVLTLEVPAVYEIRGDGRVPFSGTGHDVTAVIQPEGGEKTSVELDPDGSVQVGLGANPNGPPTTLLQLTARP
jgi:hypothetical protein